MLSCALEKETRSIIRGLQINKLNSPFFWEPKLNTPTIYKKGMREYHLEILFSKKDNSPLCEIGKAKVN